jgi:hypothetical protein
VIVGFLQVWIYMVRDRAYVSIAEISAESPKAGDAIVIHFAIKNSGRLTAFVSRANVTFYRQFVGHPLPDVPNYNLNITTFSALVGPLASGEVFHATVRPVDAKAGRIEWWSEDFLPPPRIYVYGFLEYDDGFRMFHLWRPRVVGFCGCYDVINSKPSKVTFSTCDEENYLYCN